jgi:hypothetical protein
MFLNVAIAGDWTELAARLDALDTITRWAAVQPALGVATSVAMLPELVRRGADPEKADAVIGALAVQSAADGGDDPDALLVTVHLLSDGVFAAAARLRDLSPDVVALLVGQLVVQLRTYPWQRRRRAHAKGLLLDARRAVCEELGVGRKSRHRHLEVPLDPASPTTATVLAAPAQRADPAELEGEVEDLVMWATRHGIASEADLRLLLELARQRDLGYGHGGRLAVAARYGVDERTIRRRRDRTLAALRAARPAYLAAVA